MTVPLFERVSADRVREVWSFVAEGLAAIILECPTVPWNSADILRVLLDGRAALYVHADGFVVLTRPNEELSGKPYLGVWLLWFRPGRAEPLFEEIVAWLDRVRDDTGCCWWEFTSTRGGWTNAMAEVCEPPRYTFRRLA